MPGELEEEEVESMSPHNPRPVSSHDKKNGLRSVVAEAKWAVVPILAMVPVITELIESYARRVLAFSDPYDLELVVIRTVLFGVIGVYITVKSLERERVFSDLEASESRYRGLFDNSRDPISVTTRDGLLVDANEAFISLFGYSMEELKHLNVLQLYVDADERTRFKEEVESRGSARNFEVKLRRKNGTVIDCERSSSLRRDGDGGVIGYETITRDVTERKQTELARQRMQDELEQRVAERTRELVVANDKLRQEIAERQRAESELRRSEERFRAVFESAQDCIFIKDRDLNYTHVNPAMLRLLSMSSDGMIGSTDEALFGVEASRGLKAMELRVLQGRTIEAEQNIPLKGGHVILSCIRSPLQDAAGSIVGIYGIARDLTDRKAKEAELLDPPGGYESRSMKAVLEQVALASRTDSIVLLLGESGTGKDYLARHLHDKSNRSGGPFFAINCAALPSELAESELFGHEAGAFTGSRGRKRGLLELAEGGTLLLNEIGDLPINLQAKLLSFLDTQSFNRVGGERSVEVNTRVIAATNRDLDREVTAGNFREDLFYRLNVIAIDVPPLRHRMEDLPLLVADLVASLAKKMGFSESPGVEPAVVHELAKYQWPGNVRELKNVLERALILCDKKKITVSDVGRLTGSGERKSHRVDLSCSVAISEAQPLPTALREAERSLATQALRRSGGSIKNAAVRLGISRDQMKYLMKTFGIRRNDYQETAPDWVNITHA